MSLPSRDISDWRILESDWPRVFLGAPSHAYTNLKAYFLPFAHVYLHTKGSKSHGYPFKIYWWLKAAQRWLTRTIFVHNVRTIILPGMWFSQNINGLLAFLLLTISRQSQWPDFLKNSLKPFFWVIFNLLGAFSKRLVCTFEPLWNF